MPFMQLFHQKTSLTSSSRGTKARLEALIHPPQDEEVGLSEEHLNMVRMVPLDDEVSDVY